MRIVLLYAGILTVFFVVLSVRTIRLRNRLGVAIGDGDDATLRRAIRVHANFAEYVPLALLLIALVEVSGSPSWLVHALGAVLVVARIAHAAGVSQVRERLAYRIAGVAMTFSVLVVAAVSCVVTFVARTPA